MGKRFGRLTVIRQVERKPSDNKARRWLCVCDCGNEITAITSRLKNGHVRSCGCLSRETTSKTKKTHGECRSRLYVSWCRMKARCYYPKTRNFHRWGGRGIKVCDEWKNDFLAFKSWAVANGYRDDLTLDRIDSDGNYCAENCRWIPIKEQARNRSTNVRYQGKCLVEWAEETGISLKTLSYRLRHGWSFEKALKTQVRQQHTELAFNTETTS